MARTMILAGKIGPAFSGAHVESHGSAHSAQTETFALDLCFAVMFDNLIEAINYVSGSLADDGDYFWSPRNDFSGAMVIRAWETGTWID